MIEAEIEKSLINEFKKLNIEGLRFVGSWDVASPGEVKGVEGATYDALATVRVSTRTYEGYSYPWCIISCSLGLAYRSECDATGEKFIDAMERFTTRFNDWQMSFDDAMNVFSIPGKFDFYGFLLTGGEAPQIDDEIGCWIAAQTFDIKGSITR